MPSQIRHSGVQVRYKNLLRTSVLGRLLSLSLRIHVKVKEHFTGLPLYFSRTCSPVPSPNAYTMPLFFRRIISLMRNISLKINRGMLLVACRSKMSPFCPWSLLGIEQYEGNAFFEGKWFVGSRHIWLQMQSSNLCAFQSSTNLRP